MAHVRHGALAALLAMGLFASGCQKAPEPEEQTNDAQPAEPVPPPPKPAPPPAAKPVSNAVAPIAADEDKPSADEQVREDAEATGMTSRLPPADGPADQSSPAAAGNAQQ